MEYFPWNPKTYQFQKRQKLASDKTEKSSRLPGFQPIITVIGGNCYDRCVLAQGFEEIEALAVVDVLRRAELPVKTVGVGGKEITGAHGICVKADMEEKEVSTDELEAVVLPGGMPGTLNLENRRL